MNDDKVVLELMEAKWEGERESLEWQREIIEKEILNADKALERIKLWKERLKV